jgi:UDP-N-acetylmuramoyl-L-alanyl-D-glutamate--2,6-diaminopimelate ligase
MMAAQSRMTGVSLAWLLQDLASGVIDTQIHIQGLAVDSRYVRPGDLFLAHQGLQTHGLEYVEQAVARGAAAIAWEPVADTRLAAIADGLTIPRIPVAGLGQKLGLVAARFYAHPTKDMNVIGVTGTDGKTSVTHFIAQALSGSRQPCGLLGTLGYGVYGQLQSPSHTTPDALRLQIELAALRDQGVRHVAMEVSSHALHQHRIAGVEFDVAVLTHLSRDHLDYHGSVEAYAEAKRRLFALPDLACAVLNVKDDFGRGLAADLKDRVRVIAYATGQRGVARECRDWIELQSVRPLETGLALQVDSSWGAAAFEVPLLGAFNAENLMAALGALLASGLSLETAARHLSEVKTVPGRMELFRRPGMPRVVVDYAHTPNALETALQALRPHCSGELVCVFGAGGDRDQGKRSLMGAAAERVADRVILNRDNPRNENPEDIIDQIASGFQQPQRALRIIDRAAAIEEAVSASAVDDLVLVAGKGHEDYQQIGGDKLAFSDRSWVQGLLRRRGA